LTAFCQREPLGQSSEHVDRLPFFPDWNYILVSDVHVWEERNMARPEHFLSAGVAITFLVAMIFTSHLFIESRSATHRVQGMNDAMLVKMSHQKSLP
jgi:hypothetical protein